MKNFLLLFPVAAIFGWASYELWRDYQRQPEMSEQAGHISIGHILTAENNVKRKTEDSPYWYSVKNNDPVYEKDILRTGASSSLKIQLQDKSTIQLEQNSLVVLEKKNNQFQVDFKVGQFSTKSESANFFIKVKDALIQSKAAELNVKTSDTQVTEIQVLKGQAQVTDKNQKAIQMDINKQLQIDAEGKAKELQVVLLLSSPEDKTRVLDPRQKIDYPFTWAVVVPNVKRESLEVSTSEKFEPQFTIKKWAHQASEMPISQGENYWRVGYETLDPKTHSPRIEYTKARRIQLMADERIQILSPTNNTQFELSPEDRSVSFQWQSKEQAALFLVEISSTPSFTNILKNIKTKETHASFTDLLPGGYFWRVRGFNNANASIGVSSTQAFSVTMNIPKFPLLSAPENNFIWSLSEPLRFEWKKYDLAATYQITIARDAFFKTILKQDLVKEPSLIWHWTSKGDYYWHVDALNEKNEKVGQSLTYKFQIQPSVSTNVIQLLAPKGQEKLVREKQEVLAPVAFEWQSTIQLTPNYELWIADNISMTNPIQIENLKTLRTTYTLKDSGTYFWKIIWKDPKSDKTHESKIQAFVYEISSNTPPPLLTSPVTKTKFYTGNKAQVKLQWKPRVPAVSSKIFFEKWNPRTEQKIPFTEINSITNEWQTAPLEPGTYFWKVRTIDKDGTESTTSDESEFTIEMQEGLGAPKLKPVIVK